MKESSQKLLLTLSGILAPLALFALIDFAYTKITKGHLRSLGIPFISDKGEYSNMFNMNSETGWYQPKSNLSGKTNYGPITYHVKTDRCGFRVPSQPTETSLSVDSTLGVSNLNKNNLPIIFVGDSFVWGSGAEYSESLVGHYSKISNRQLYNLGVASYSPTAYLHRLKYFVNECPKKSIKDVDVVLLIDLSDVQDESSYWFPTSAHSEPINRYRLREYGIAKANYYQIKKALKYFIARHFSITNNTLTQLLHKIKSYQSSSSDGNLKYLNPRYSLTYTSWDRIDNFYYPLGVKDGMIKTVDSIKDFAEFVDSRGGRLHIVTFPRSELIDNKSTIFNWEKYIESVCLHARCSSVIHTQTEYETLKSNRKNWRDDFYLINDGHFNSRGYKILATTIYQNIEKK